MATTHKTPVLGVLSLSKTRRNVPVDMLTTAIVQHTIGVLKMLREKLGLEGRQFTEVAAPLFAYLFHRIDQRAFIQYIDNREITDRVLDVVKTDGYILKNCKLYAWAIHKQRELGGPRPSREQYGVEPQDATFLRRLNLSHLDKKFESYELQDFDHLVEDTLFCSSMKQHIGKLISKKLIFLTRSYGVERRDIEKELESAAIYAMYKQYPRFQCLLHFKNTAKTAIHNTAMSLISHYTCPSRQRLFRDANGDFQAVHAAIDNEIHKVEAGPNYLAHIKDDLELIVSRAPRMKPQVQRFIMVCAGHFDKEFSEFLQNDNSMAVDVMAYSRYLSKARKFFGFSEDGVERIFNRLKFYLAGGVDRMDHHQRQHRQQHIGAGMGARA